MSNETNYTYFGARYYDSDLSSWLSVDPLAAARPNLSPYNYCQNNPVVRVDPTGMLDVADGYIISKNGDIKLVNKIGGDSYDVLWTEDAYVNGVRGYDYEGSGKGGIRIDDAGFISGIQSIKSEAIQGNWITKEPIQGYYSEINGNQAKSVFEFLSDATSTPKSGGPEWSIIGTTAGKWAIGTLKESSQAFSFSKIEKFSDLSTHAYRAHSHGGAFDYSFRPSGLDKNSAKSVRRFNSSAVFELYMPEYTKNNYNNAMKGKYYNYAGRLIPYPPLKNEPSSKYIKY